MQCCIVRLPHTCECSIVLLVLENVLLCCCLMITNVMLCCNTHHRLWYVVLGCRDHVGDSDGAVC